jgi:hypothetical protein
MGAGAVDALVNHSLTRIERPNGTAADMGDGAASTMWDLMQTIDPAHAEGAMHAYGFGLGLRFAHLVMSEPFGDHREAMRAMIDDVLANQRQAEMVPLRRPPESI